MPSTVFQVRTFAKQEFLGVGSTPENELLIGLRRHNPVLDFIQLLIQHVPEKHFKMTRYYGLYARHREIDSSLHKAIPKSKQRTLLDFNTWRMLILLSFGYDPLQCPKCNQQMLFLELYHKRKRVSLEELYERTMAPYRCRSSGKSA